VGVEGRRLADCRAQQGLSCFVSRVAFSCPACCPPIHVLPWLACRLSKLVTLKLTLYQQMIFLVSGTATDLAVRGTSAVHSPCWHSHAGIGADGRPLQWSCRIKEMLAMMEQCRPTSARVLCLHRNRPALTFPQCFLPATWRETHAHVGTTQHGCLCVHGMCRVTTLEWSVTYAHSSNRLQTTCRSVSTVNHCSLVATNGAVCCLFPEFVVPARPVAWPGLCTQSCLSLLWTASHKA